MSKRFPVAGFSLVTPLASSPVRGSISAATPEVSIVGEIGDSVTGATVRERLASIGSAKDVKVHLNSEGGSIIEGIAIYHALRRHEGRKTAIVEGMAASMASVVLQAADERRVTRGSFVMIHNPNVSLDSAEAKDLDRMSALMAKMREDMLDIYEARTGQPRDKIAQMMDDETWLSAEECVALGFADKIDDSDAKIEASMVAKLVAKAKKIPASLQAANKGTAKMAMTDEEAEAIRSELKALKAENAKLKASAESDDEEDPSAEADTEEETEEDKPHSEDDDEDDAKAVIAAARRITGKKSLAEVEGSLMAIGARRAADIGSARAAEVDALVKSGYLLPRDKSWALKASDKSFAAYKAANSTPKVPTARITPPAHKPGEENPGDNEPTDAEKAYAKSFGKPVAEVIKLRTATYQTKSQVKETA